MANVVRRAIRDLLAVVSALNRAYPHKAFTLDGRLVGDIGEILVAEAYDVELFDKLEHHHDCRSGRRLVQIKSTMKASLTFPGNHVPDFYIGIKIESNGSFRTIFNGPGHIIAARLRGRKIPKNNLHSISIKILEELNEGVPERQRIRRRSAQAGACA